MRISRCIPKATDTALRICNTHCFSTAKMVTPSRLNIKFIRTLPVLLHPGVSPCSGVQNPVFPSAYGSSNVSLVVMNYIRYAC